MSKEGRIFIFEEILAIIAAFIIIFYNNNNNVNFIIFFFASQTLTHITESQLRNFCKFENSNTILAKAH